MKDSVEVVEVDKFKSKAVDLTNCEAITTETHESAEIVTAESDDDYAESDDDDTDAFDVCKYCSMVFFSRDEFLHHLRDNHLQTMLSEHPQYYRSEDAGNDVISESSQAFFDVDKYQNSHSVYPQNPPIVYTQNSHTVYPQNPNTVYPHNPHPHIVYPQNQNSWNFFSA